MVQSQRTRARVWRQLLVTILVLGAITFALQQFLHPTLLAHYLLEIKRLGPMGIVAFVVIYNLATLLFIPGALLTLGGGVLYGPFWGAVYGLIAATLGATGAFLIGRYLARAWVTRRLQRYPKFQAIDQAVAHAGFKIVFLTRLSPLFPFNLINYAFGVTRVSLKDYVLGSIGMVPGTVMYAYLGALAGDLTHLGAASTIPPEVQTAHTLTHAIGFIATVIVTIYLTHIAKTALNQSLTAGDAPR